MSLPGIEEVERRKTGTRNNCAVAVLENNVEISYCTVGGDVIEDISTPRIGVDNQESTVGSANACDRPIDSSFAYLGGSLDVYTEFGTMEELESEWPNLADVIRSAERK